MPKGLSVPKDSEGPLGIYSRLCASSASPKGSGTLYMPKGLSVPKDSEGPLGIYCVPLCVVGFAESEAGETTALYMPKGLPEGAKAKGL